MFFISTTPDSISKEALLVPCKDKFWDNSVSNSPDNSIVPFFYVETIGAWLSRIWKKPSDPGK